MPAAERQAHVVWDGNLVKGIGTLSLGTGALREQPVSWASRVERPDGKTSPEELLAAAQASCYAMALSHTLTEKGTPPDRLDVTATATADFVGGGLKVTTMDIQVRGWVRGLDQAQFQQIASDAEKGCPIANAIRNNVEIRVKAQLEGGLRQ